MACEFSPNGEAEELNLMKDQAKLQLVGHEEEVEKGTPVKYVPLCDLYSATSPCTGGASGSSNVMSKKVKARKINHFEGEDRKKVADTESEARPPVIHFYSRKRRRPKPSFFESLVVSQENAAAPPVVVKLEEGEVEESVKKKRRKIGKCELIKLGADSTILDAPRLGKFKNFAGIDAGNWSVKRRKNGEVDRNEQSTVNSGSIQKKKWVGLSFDGADPRKFVGLQCQVYWPLDADWYYGRVVGYNPETGRHHVKYKDCDEENLILSNERVRFCISQEDMRDLKLSCGLASSESDVHDIDEMIALAASLDDSLEELEPGNIIWAKLTGHAMWPAIVLDDCFAHDQKGLKRILGEKSVLVQFFGTHDFARIRTKQIMSFLRGLLSSFHLKCKKSKFIQSLEEAKIYLSGQKLSERMLCLQNGIKADNCESSSGEGENSADLDDDSKRNEGMQRKVGGLKNDLFEIGDLQELSFSSNSRLFSKTSKLAPGRYHDVPVGYRPVNVKWKDLDKCNVCHMDEEYENNLFLQCDKCRMMVHARCYGEVEPVDGILWLCNLCRPGAPEFPPPCCLCPVIGGAMKPTTDGQWAHLACAIWIPETCLSDIKKMEPIDGLSRINKDRWKLLCSICEVSYGACIQCSNNSCCVAYHPLCARVAGFCVELEDEDRLHLIHMDEDEEDQCIRLLSYCKKHRLPSNDRLATDDRIGQIFCQSSDYNPPSNPSGCARCEPYNYFGRRGRKEPEALAAVSLKRLFVENRPYLVGGYSQHEPFQNMVSSGSVEGSRFSISVQRLKAFQLDTSKSIGSMTEKYNYMRETFRKRLAFGKSGIHGFGIFAKVPHRAGDMVIEYTGELVRPSIADHREHLIYNSLVGAGTYMFRIDDERVIDATRAGSIAHLINHSCEPNCYSRTISVNGDEHIIIFAKRDIKQWEELTYDYRFFSIDEKLACYCGFSSCRGIVNDIDSGERMAKVYAPRSELTAWEGD